jgi:hypothetical protein
MDDEEWGILAPKLWDEFNDVLEPGVATSQTEDEERIRLWLLAKTEEEERIEAEELAARVAFNGGCLAAALACPSPEAAAKAAEEDEEEAAAAKQAAIEAETARVSEKKRARAGAGAGAEQQQAKKAEATKVRAELAGLTVGALRKRAKTAGAEMEWVSEAIDEYDRDTIIELIVEAMATDGSLPLVSPEPEPEQQQATTPVHARAVSLAREERIASRASQVMRSDSSESD